MGEGNKRKVEDEFGKVCLGSLLYMKEGLEHVIKLWNGFQSEKRRGEQKGKKRRESWEWDGGRWKSEERRKFEVCREASP